MKKGLLLLNIVFVITILANGQKFEGLAETPPMGWNSWNCFACEGINEQVIMEIADAMEESGMKEAGYEYIVIDDCWQTGREADGTITADPDKFPSGMKALADYIHSKGLKFGIYSDAGRGTCQNRPGSRGYEFQDARTYAAWGVDFLKYDWCNTGTQNAQASYQLMRDALYQAGRPVLFSMCEWGLSQPWLWAKDVAHMWRTTGDIRNNWDIPDAKEGKVWGGGVIVNLDMQQGLEEFAGPGGWNDPDMLYVGNGVLTEEEDRAHFSLWCMLSAPLMTGNDLRYMPESTRALLTNRELIAIDQDPLGKQGFKIKDYGEFEVYYKPLQNDDIAVCLFNRFDFPVHVELDWTTLNPVVFINNKKFEIKTHDIIDRKDVGLDGNYKIRDLWKKQFIGDTGTKLKTDILKHDVLVVRLVKN